MRGPSFTHIVSCVFGVCWWVVSLFCFGFILVFLVFLLFFCWWSNDASFSCQGWGEDAGEEFHLEKSQYNGLVSGPNQPWCYQAYNQHAFIVLNDAWCCGVCILTYKTLEAVKYPSFKQERRLPSMHICTRDGAQTGLF